MQVTADSTLSRSTSRARPPLPQGPRTRTQTEYTHPSAFDSNNSALWTFSRPPISFAAVSELTGTSPISPSSSSPPTVIPVPKATTLVPPPILSFDPPPFPLKGLPLSVAQWTYTSQELQEIVSRAIRLSARESYIRLLSLNTLDEQLPKECERLGTLKKTTQAKYRFHVQRRTMLLQALNSFSTSFNQKTNKNKSGKGGNDTKDGSETSAFLQKLAVQLVETTTAMDTLTTDLIRIASHQSQISSLVSTHWGSALAIALRKLNSSYARRTRELEDAARSIAMLEAEITDAWTEADRLAGEMDDLEEFADGISIQRPPSYVPPAQEPPETPDGHGERNLRGKSAEYDLTYDFLDDEGEAVIKTAEVVSLRRASIAMSSIYESPPFSQPFSSTESRATPTIRSIRRVHSSDALSTRSGLSIASRRARVSAAKTRSRRASIASLRLPASHRGSRPGSCVGQGQEDEELPPLPIMPEALAQIAQTAMFPRSSRRRSETGGARANANPALSFISSGSGRGTRRRGGAEIEIVPQRNDYDRMPSPPLDLPPISLRSDMPQHHSSLKNVPASPDPTSPSPSRTTTTTAASIIRNTTTRTKQTLRTLFRHGSETFLRKGPREAEGSVGGSSRGVGIGARSELQLVPDDEVLEFGGEEAWRSIATGVIGPDSIVSDPILTPHAMSCISSIGSLPSAIVENDIAGPSPSTGVRRTRSSHQSRLTRLKTVTKRYTFSLSIFRGRKRVVSRR